MNAEDLYRFGIAGSLALPGLLLVAGTPVGALVSPAVVAALVFVSIAVGFVLHQAWHVVFSRSRYASRRRGAIAYIMDYSATPGGTTPAAAFNRWEGWMQARLTSAELARARRQSLLHHSFATSFIASLFVLLVSLWQSLESQQLHPLATIYLPLTLLFGERMHFMWNEYNQFDSHLARHAPPDELGIRAPESPCSLCGLPSGKSFSR